MVSLSSASFKDVLQYYSSLKLGGKWSNTCITGPNTLLLVRLLKDATENDFKTIHAHLSFKVYFFFFLTEAFH